MVILQTVNSWENWNEWQYEILVIFSMEKW